MAVISELVKQVFCNAPSGILCRMRLMQQRKATRSPRAKAPTDSRKGSPVALSILGCALALMGIAGAGMNVAHGQMPWPADFFTNAEVLEAILRTFVTAVLGVCLMVVLHDPASDQARVRTDDSRKH